MRPLTMPQANNVPRQLKLDMRRIRNVPIQVAERTSESTAKEKPKSEIEKNLWLAKGVRKNFSLVNNKKYKGKIFYPIVL